MFLAQFTYSTTESITREVTHIFSVRYNHSREKKQVPVQKKKKNTNNRRGSRTTYQKFRQEVLTRDHYQCVICHKHQTKGLRVHHIHSWKTNKKMRMKLDNAVTLCAHCHDSNVIGSFHYVYGSEENTLEEFQEYFKCRTGRTFNTDSLKRGFQSVYS